ncbi:unnamed protein product [Alternaria alternata]
MLPMHTLLSRSTSRISLNILPTLRADGDRLVYESLRSELQQRLEEQRQDDEAYTTREEEGTMSEAVATQSALPTAKPLSPSPSAGNTSNPNRVAIQPFKNEQIRYAPPGSWKDGTDSLQDGLPNIGKKYLAHYAADDLRWGCSDPQLLRTSPRDIFLACSANQAGIRPTILSVGADGWFCDAKAIVPWLQATILKFDLVLYLNCLPNGISTKFADEHYGAWWIRHDPQLILKALESGLGLDEKADELIAAWKILQDSKDSSFGKSYGRNHINPNTLFPILE